MATPELMYRARRCIKCGECIKSCPKGAIQPSAEENVINRSLCDVCGECSKKCPTGALTVVGREVNLMEVLVEIAKDAIFYEESNGGITISGGEPLMQLEFLDALLEKCKENNIHTAVDTCGYAPPEAFEKIRGKVDLFLYDIKIMDEEKHIKYTGVSNKLILENLRRLAQNGSKIWIRFPVIPSVNDDEENLKKMAEFLISNGIKQISLLPYHRSGIEKYKGLGKVYKMEEIQSPSDEDMRIIKEKLEKFGLKAKIGGG